jgi:ribosomal-protein-alanine N-acetyltransferase
MIRLERQSTTAAHWREAEYRRLFQGGDRSPPRLALIADRDLVEQLRNEVIRVVGFLIAHSMGAEWELENVVVADDFRGKGIGTRLIEEFLARARQAKSQSVFLEVRQSNTAARALYAKVGFHEIGRRKSYYTAPLEDAVLYSKSLAAG